MEPRRNSTLPKLQDKSAHLHSLILVVEDDEDQLHFFQEMLTVRGYDVVTAQSARAALEILNELHVDLVVSDVMMPDISGQELVRALRRTRGHSGLPVIAISAEDDVSEDDLVGCGADMFIKKREASARLVIAVDKLVKGPQDKCDLLLQIRSRYAHGSHDQLR